MSDNERWMCLAKQIVLAPVFWPMFLIGMLFVAIGAVGEFLMELAEEIWGD